VIGRAGDTAMIGNGAKRFEACDVKTGHGEGLS
jgi:hypothetical protein